MRRYELFFDVPGGNTPTAVVTGKNRAIATAMRVANQESRIVYVIDADREMDDLVSGIVPGQGTSDVIGRHLREHEIEQAQWVQHAVESMLADFGCALDALRIAATRVDALSTSEAEKLRDSQASLARDFTNTFGVIVGIEPDYPLPLAAD